MAQSNSIGFALVIGFVVYITVKGELPAYLCVVGFGSGCQSSPASSNNSSGVSSPGGVSVGGQPVNITVISNPVVTTGYSPIDTSGDDGDYGDDGDDG